MKFWKWFSRSQKTLPIPAVPTALVAVVLHNDRDYLFLDYGPSLTTTRPILIQTDQVAEHVIDEVNALLQDQSILHQGLDLVPHEVTLAPIINLTLNLVLVSVTREEFELARHKVWGKTVDIGQIMLHRDNNIFFELVSRTV